VSRAQVNRYEIGPSAQPAATVVSIPAQPMQAGILLSGVERADQPAKRIVQARPHVHSGRQLILDLYAAPHRDDLRPLTPIA
jgi:hypothetical protein